MPECAKMPRHAPGVYAAETVGDVFPGDLQLGILGIAVHGIRPNRVLHAQAGGNGGRARHLEVARLSERERGAPDAVTPKGAGQEARVPAARQQQAAALVRLSRQRVARDGGVPRVVQQIDLCPERQAEESVRGGERVLWHLLRLGAGLPEEQVPGR